MIIHTYGLGCRYRLLGKTLEIVDASSTSIGTYHCIVTHSATGQVKSGDVSLSKFDLLNHQVCAFCVIVLSQVFSGEPHGFSLKVACQVSLQVIASVMNMFSR